MPPKARSSFRFPDVRRAAVAATAVLGVAACGSRDLPVPTAQEVEARYRYAGRLSVDIQGNVAEITVEQPLAQLRRGGVLWARVGPYIVLFTEETRDLLRAYPGLAGVRVITVTPRAEEVARAFLARDALNELTWRRALNVAGRARRDGTDQPRRLEELVRWGEDHTEFEYDPRHASPR